MHKKQLELEDCRNNEAISFDMLVCVLFKHTHNISTTIPIPSHLPTPYTIYIQCSGGRVYTRNTVINLSLVVSLVTVFNFPAPQSKT